MRVDHINFEALKTFEIAAQELSFTKAAFKLNITQSAVSQQIKILENRLEFSLFIREKRHLKLTDKGQILYESVSKSFSEIYQTLLALQRKTQEFNINCLPSLALQWLMPRLSDFHLNYPNVRVKFKAEFQNLNIHLMQSLEIDLAVRFDPYAITDNFSEVLFDEYLIAVATPTYLEKHPDFAQGKSLDGVTLLHDATPWIGAPAYIEWQTWLEKVKPEWLNLLGGLEFNLSSLAIAAALNHQGVAIGRSAIIYDELVSGRLVNIFETSVQSIANYKLLYINDNNPDVGVFANWLKKQIADFEVQRNKYIMCK